MYFRQWVATAEFMLNSAFWTASVGTRCMDTFMTSTQLQVGCVLLKSEQVRVCKIRWTQQQQVKSFLAESLSLSPDLGRAGRCVQKAMLFLQVQSSSAVVRDRRTDSSGRVSAEGNPSCPSAWPACPGWAAHLLLQHRAWRLSKQPWVCSSEQTKRASLHKGYLSHEAHRQKILWMLRLSMGLGAN